MSGGPNGGMRPIYRRTFYVLITVALITVYIQVGKISNVSTVLRKQLNETEGELASERTALQHSNRHLKHAVAGNVLLMALNVLIAYRGVQIWSMLQGWALKAGFRRSRQTRRGCAASARLAAPPRSPSARRCGPSMRPLHGGMQRR